MPCWRRLFRLTYFGLALDDQLDKDVQSTHDVEDELAEGVTSAAEIKYAYQKAQELRSSSALKAVWPKAAPHLHDLLGWTQALTLDEYSPRDWVTAVVDDLTRGVAPPSRFPEFVELVKIFTTSFEGAVSYAILSTEAERECQLLFDNIKAWSSKCWVEGNYEGGNPISDIREAYGLFHRMNAANTILASDMGRALLEASMTENNCRWSNLYNLRMGLAPGSSTFDHLDSAYVDVVQPEYGICKNPLSLYASACKLIHY